jgi:ankyrin repeat protein
MIDKVNRDHLSINTMSWNGMTIQHLACDAGLADLLEPLFWRGASLETFDEVGLTPLEWAVKSGDLDTVLFALALGADPALGTPFTKASFAGRRDIMMALAKYGADVNEEDSNGDTALGCAVSEEYLEGVRFLLSLGAHANLAIYYGTHSIFIMLAPANTRTLTAVSMRRLFSSYWNMVSICQVKISMETRFSTSLLTDLIIEFFVLCSVELLRRMYLISTMAMNGPRCTSPLRSLISIPHTGDSKWYQCC